MEQELYSASQTPTRSLLLWGGCGKLLWGGGNCWGQEEGFLLTSSQYCIPGRSGEGPAKL